ncbi:DUF3160 domain-containing protein [Pendulispora rubella]|uniref:DUF3160 domain-containing protein n=1 Tax=Pendulispora rubella TaxID=2741070 RepID=A0ABZ2LF61_9BACT
MTHLPSSCRRFACLALVAVVASDCSRAPAAAPSHAEDAEAPAPAELTREEICAATPAAVGEALPGGQPVPPPSVRVEPPPGPRRSPPPDWAICGDTEGTMACSSVDTPPDPKDLCFVANANIARAEREMRAARPTPALASKASKPWDGSRPVQYMDHVAAHLHFTAEEKERLRTNGFVALDRFTNSTYMLAYHNIFQEQLPVYVSIDSILHTIFRGNGVLLRDIEISQLGPKLVKSLDRLRKTLRNARAIYGKETAGDLDVYLGVAYALLHGYASDKPVSLFDNEEPISDLAHRGFGAEGLADVELFGRTRVVDFGQFAPRGHYATNGADRIGPDSSYVTLEQYFRSMMWLSRLEFNLVSRSCRSSQPGASPDPTETPREAKDALALADLAARAGVLDDIRAFETVYSTFAGAREDVSIFDLLNLTRKAGIGPNDPNAQPKLAAAIGQGFQRHARIHYMPQDATVLPAIATLFGPRIVPDIAPLTAVVHDALPNRTHLGAGDVGFVLGHDRAAAYLADKVPGLEAALGKARTQFHGAVAGKGDLYGLWLRAVERLAETPRGVLPSFMKKDAYADMRLNSALVGYGQIRHNYVLVAGQGYDSWGCEIPDGWVEPALGTYDALIAYARAAKRIDPQAARYFSRVETVLSTLRSIVVTELSGAPLSEPQRRWLGMVTEYAPQGLGDSGGPPSFTGWYFDLFPDRGHGAEADADFVADYFTLTNAGEVAHLGAESPRLAAFVVDVGGEPRVMVGPVAKGYEIATSLSDRLNDEQAREAQGKKAPWGASYFVAAPEPPPLSTTVATCKDDVRIVVRSPKDLGDVRVAALDHHGDAVTVAATAHVTAGQPKVLAFRPKGKPEGFHVHVVGAAYDTVVPVAKVSRDLY